MNPRPSRVVTFRRIALAFICAMTLAEGLYLNRFGVEIEPDSAVMIVGGLRFAHGEGVSIPNLIGPPMPMTWFPPMVSWLVALCERTGIDYRTAFGVLNACAWAALAGWTGWLASRVAGGSSRAGILAAAAVATSGAMCIVHGTLYSEPFFLLWSMGALAAVARWWKTPLARWAAVAGLCTTGALLTRYVGITLAATCGIVMLARPGPGRGRRLMHTTFYSLLGGGPFFAWLFFQTHLHHGDSPRDFSWHPVDIGTLQDGVRTISSFLISSRYADSLPVAGTVVAIACVAVLAALWFWWRGRGDENAIGARVALSPLAVMGALFVVIYIAFLLLSISIADADTPLDERLLSIIIPPGLLFLAWLAGAVLHGAWSRRILTTIATALLVVQAISTTGMVRARKEVLWSAGSTSATLDALRTLPPGAIVYSNDPYSIYMAYRIRTEPIPYAPGDDATPQSLRQSHEQTDGMKETIAAKGGWVVYWDTLGLYDPVVDRASLKEIIEIKEITEFDDGCLMRVGPLILPVNNVVSGK